MPDTNKLPFTIPDIHAIKWAPGEPACIVTYFVMTQAGTKVRRVKKTTIAQMESIQPSFRRLHACAAELHNKVRKPSALIAYDIRRWHKELMRRDPSNFLIKHQHIWAWNGVVSFQLGARKPSEKNPYVTDPRPFLRMAWENGASAYFEYPLIEANCPGFVDWCKVLCDENGVDGVEAFAARRAFVEDLPYEVLVANKAAFTNQLRSVMAMGPSVGEAVSLMRASAREAPDTASVETLPGLSSELTCEFTT
jgi:hypothetical protein